MAIPKFFKNDNGHLTLAEIGITSTTGAADGEKVIVTDPTTGKLHASFLQSVSKLVYVGVWADKPVGATLTAYTDRIFITNVGIGGSEWYWDGTRWRVVGGQVVLFSGNTGAVVDVATTTKLINVQIPSGIIKARDRVNLVSFIKKTGTTGTHGYDFRISNSDDTSTTSNTTAINSFVINGVASASVNLTIGQELEVLSDTSVYFSGVGAGSTVGFGGGTTAHEQIASAGTFLSQPVFLGIRVNQVNAADRINLLDFTVTLKTCG